MYSSPKFKIYIVNFRNDAVLCGKYILSIPMGEDDAAGAAGRVSWYGHLWRQRFKSFERKQMW